jgi:hypothetical protein
MRRLGYREKRDYLMATNRDNRRMVGREDDDPTVEYAEVFSRDEFIDNEEETFDPEIFKSKQISLMTAVATWFVLLAAMGFAGTLMVKLCVAILG